MRSLGGYEQKETVAVVELSRLAGKSRIANLDVGKEHWG